MVNQKHTDLGIPNRFSLTPSRFRSEYASLLRSRRDGPNILHAGKDASVLPLWAGLLASASLIQHTAQPDLLRAFRIKRIWSRRPASASSPCTTQCSIRIGWKKG